MKSVYSIILSVLCVFSLQQVEASAVGVQRQPLGNGTTADDYARLLSAYAQEYARYQATLGGRLSNLDKGSGIDMDMGQLIRKISRAVDEAKISVDQAKIEYEKIPLWMSGLSVGRKEAYVESVQKVLRRLAILEAVITSLVDGKIERVRSKLTTLLQIYTATYDELASVYSSNLQALKRLRGLEGITPQNIYQFIGIGATEDPKKISLASLKEHIKARADIIRMQDKLIGASAGDENLDGNATGTTSNWWVRQMGYLFPDAKAKERYDAWLDGKKAYVAWQQAELESLGMTAEDLGGLALQHVINIGEFKAELDALRTKIRNMIGKIKFETGIQPVPLSP